MRGKKGIFGYISSIGKSTRTQNEWFDPSTFLIHGQSALPEDEAQPRFYVAYILLALAMLTFGLRLTKIQITEGSENRYLAEGNRIRRQISIAPRGAIVDKKGEQLVVNEAGYRFDIIPADLPLERQAREAVLRQVADQKKVPYNEVVEKVANAGFGSLDPVTIVATLPREDALVDKIKFATTPGVHVSFVPSRKYDTLPGLSHLIGYTSQMNDQDVERHPDYHSGSPIGRAGVESSYDAELRGDEGVSEIEVNANGQFQRSLQQLPPKVGKTLHLTLDKGLQQEMANALQEAMGKEKAKQAVGIALDPRTGGILASVSLPSYDNNLFAKGVSAADYQKLSTDPEKPLLNRAVNGLYPPGSTVKPFVAAAALQEKTITPQTKLDTSAGVIEIGDFRFPDWKVHGVTDIGMAIAESNDIMFYALGGGWKQIPPLGLDRLNKYYAMFGLGRETGVDYTTELTGVVPDNEWKQKVMNEPWYIGDTYHVSIGQGNLLSTPLQMARGIASLVNGGRLITPHLVESTEDSATKEINRLSFPEEKLALSDSTIDSVKRGMWLTVNSETGSARALRSLPFVTGGKTGTAEFGTEAKTHAWYVGFAPFDNPEIAVAILVEGGGEGNAISVPVAGRVFDYYMSHR